MKRFWLRGMLLGVSLSLLLAGGAALAQGLSIKADKGCFECELEWAVPVSTELDLDNVVEFMVEDGGAQICFDFWVDGESTQERWCHDGQTYFYMHAWCEEEVVFSGHTPFVDDVGASHASFPFEFGEWTVAGAGCEPSFGADVNALQGCEASVILARDCSAYEFVPEPGSIMLLGSGLVGLAGYATLRWRTRE